MEKTKSGPAAPVAGESRIKSLAVSKAENGRMRFLVTSGALDRDGEVLDPAGMITDTFQGNPVMLWCHDLYLPAIGNWPVLERTAAGWEAEGAFVPAEISPFADQIRKQYEAGFLKAVSIRFRPIEWVSGKLEVDGYYTKFTKFELLEISAVNVPSNPEAVRVRGLDDYHAYVKKLNCRHCGECQETKTAPDKAPEGDPGKGPAPAGDQAGPIYDAEDGLKIGAELSKKNRSRLKKCRDRIKECHDEIDEMLSKWDEADEEEGKALIPPASEAGSVTDTGNTKSAPAEANLGLFGEPAQGTPAAEAGAKGKTDDGGFDLDGLVGEVPPPLQISEEEVSHLIEQRVGQHLGAWQKGQPDYIDYITGLSAVRDLLPE